MINSTNASSSDSFNLREAQVTDAIPLHQIEIECFTTDRLSLRRIKHWIKAQNRILIVAEQQGELLGYGLALLHRGTRLARLYSIAIRPHARGLGLAKHLLQLIETLAAEQGRLFMRLEVGKENDAAIALYTNQGYLVFGAYENYYGENQDALRMQKRIRYRPENLLNHAVPWYQQTTDFSCGPAALMMAMASLEPHKFLPNQELELDIWREATTIFMTSGHGGCHPIGLGLAAHHRGFKTQIYINKDTPLFVDGVRNQHKKAVMTTVDKHFRQQAITEGVTIKSQDISQAIIEAWLKKDAAIIMLISTYRMDGKKTPHWVTVTGMDEQCLYVHDPDPGEEGQTGFDCQHVPIARLDFEKMSSFGAERLRTAVVIYKA